jgi:hypothetical protein
MSEASEIVERTEQITVTVNQNETGTIAAEESLYDALRELEDYRRTGNDEDVHDALCDIMRAYFQATDEIHET